MATARLARAGAAPTQRKSESRSRMAWKCTLCSPSCPLKSCRAMPPGAPPPPAASMAAGPGAARPERARPEREPGPAPRPRGGGAPWARPRPPRRAAPPRPAPGPCRRPSSPGNSGTRSPLRARPSPGLPSVRAQTHARVQPPGNAPPPCPLRPELALPRPVRIPSVSHCSIPKDTARCRCTPPVLERTRARSSPGIAPPGRGTKQRQPQAWANPARWQGKPCVRRSARHTGDSGQSPERSPGVSH